MKLILDHHILKKIKENQTRIIKSVPDSFFIDCIDQAFKNHSQSLEQLKERGGLSPLEIYALKSKLLYKHIDKSNYECYLWLLSALNEDSNN